VVPVFGTVVLVVGVTTVFVFGGTTDVVDGFDVVVGVVGVTFESASEALRAAMRFRSVGV
jgi:hypothetical protein